MVDIRAVNDHEHKMHRLKGEPVTSGAEAFCARCDKVEWIRDGEATEMGPCWPKHGMRFVMIIGAGSLIAIVGLLALGVAHG